MKWGKTGNASRLFSLKRGLDQNLLNSSKKVSSKACYVKTVSTYLKRDAISIYVFFTMSIIFHDFKVLKAK